MPESVINPSAALLPNLSASPVAAKPSGEPTRSAGKAEEASSGNPPAFAEQLKKQIGKSEGSRAEAPATAKTAEAASAESSAAQTESLATSADSNVVIDALTQSDAVTPFIAQLLAQVAQLPGSKDQQAGELSDATDDPLIAIAAPVAADVVSVAEVGPVSEQAPALVDPNGRQQPGEASPAALAAISAEDQGSEGALDAAGQPAAKLEHDFGAMLQRAGEQINNAPLARTQGSHESAQLRMEAPAGHANWANELGDKLTWMSTAQRTQADLVLNPPQLGRVEISLTVSGDQANAVFASPSAAVRELLENSLPRLREVMAEAGINLGQAHVGSESPNQSGNPQRQATEQASSTIGLDGGVSADMRSAAVSVRSGRGMVDVFA